MRHTAVGLCGLALVAGCAGTGTPDTGTGAGTALPPVSVPVSVPAQGSCGRTAGSTANALPEVRGAGRGAEVWGLMFAPVPLAAGREVKIVWRMTGEGPLRVTAALPDGTAARLTWGPEAHGGSTWHRPGQEWGTGFVFPKPGCWEITLTRDRGSGTVWLPVR
ncbi:hypothetical protein [Microbispora sp. NPDC046933]|uniref:hypothetical protein n=1 Tax=Microbispora sp. NPDC046933 TaxID=3155618 RepID=UPI0034069145